MVVPQIKKAVAEALKALGVESAEISLEHPADISHGDYATNVALVYAKQLRKNPRELAGHLLERLNLSATERFNLVDRIEIAGAGFLNFYLKPEFFMERIAEILKEKDNFGKNKNLAEKKVVVEYSSPNIAKPFTIGHLRSTIIGDSVARILAFSGASVVRDNHLGDWGTQFGKLIVAIKKWGDIERIAHSATPVRELAALYVRFHTEAEKDATLDKEARVWFVKLEQGDVEARALWKQCIVWSMKAFQELYERLGVSFDTALGESFFEDKMGAVIEELKEKNILKESEGAQLVFFANEVLPPLMIIKKDGGTLYATRDLATDLWRKKEYGDEVVIVNETGMEQSLYFKQIFLLEEMLGWFKKGKRVHIGHGLTRDGDGKKMSTRGGNSVWLEEVLDEAVKRASAVNAESGEMVGIGALKFNDLKRDARQDIVFNWDEVLNLRGDSGPYLQYSYTRARSVLEKAGLQNSLSGHAVERLASATARARGIFQQKNIRALGGAPRERVLHLEQLLPRFPEVVERAGAEYAPHYLATFLIEIAGAFNNFYATHPIIGSGDAEPSRLALTEAFSIVMKNGLSLLGIDAPEKM